MYGECLNDYVSVLAGVTKSALGPGSKVAVGDGDVLDHLIIIPTTTSPGAVKITDGSAGTDIVVFNGGASSVADLKPIYVNLGARAKATGANGPRWLITTGTNVAVVAVGRFL